MTSSHRAVSCTDYHDRSPQNPVLFIKAPTLSLILFVGGVFRGTIGKKGVLICGGDAGYAASLSRYTKTSKSSAKPP